MNQFLWSGILLQIFCQRHVKCLEVKMAGSVTVMWAWSKDPCGKDNRMKIRDGPKFSSKSGSGLNAIFFKFGQNPTPVKFRLVIGFQPNFQNVTKADDTGTFHSLNFKEFAGCRHFWFTYFACFLLALSQISQPHAICEWLNSRLIAYN